MKKIAIIQFPGSNCERETILAVKRAQMQPIPFLWNEAKEKLEEMDGYIIVGGFAYEDRSRAGIIAALDPIMQTIKEQSRLGKPVLGICNGAQVLVETGLVPGLENDKLGMVLALNKRVTDGKILGTGFYNAWVNIRLAHDYQRNAFTRHLTHQDVLHIPIAHGEGRFVMNDALMKEVLAQGLHVFQYCDAKGTVSEEFPINPNGSMQSIAAIANKAGNVMAIMPHPERTKNGDAIFNSMRDYILERETKKNDKHEVVPLYYYPRKQALPSYQKQSHHHECIISLIITDNQALTVQNALRKMGIPVTVKRQIHWEIACDSLVTLEQIKKSGVLFNERKEMLDHKREPQAKTFLVRAKEDLLGRERQQMLINHFSLPDVKAIMHGVLWHFYAENANIDDQIESILSTNIIFNPYAHDCYQY